MRQFHKQQQFHKEPDTKHQTPNFDQCFHFPNASIANLIVSKTIQSGDVFESATTFD